MIIRAFKPLAGVVLAASACLAQAATEKINFDSLHRPIVGFAGNGTTYTEDNFSFTSARPGSLLALGFVLDADKNAGGETLTESFVQTALSVSRVGGGTFDLESLDLADGLNTFFGGKVTLAYTIAGVTTSKTLTLDHKIGLQTFSFARLDDLSSFSLTGAGLTTFQLDNVVVSPDAATPAVPEPAPLGLMVAGLAVLGTVARRRLR